MTEKAKEKKMSDVQTKEKSVKTNKGSQKDKSIKIRESEYLKLKQEAADYKDKYLRLFAEFENARKRMDREKMEFVRYANGGLITEFLTILDDLERSIKAAESKHKDYDAFLKGIEMVMTHIYELLRKNDVKAIETVGKKFDPNCHEVLMQEESEDHEDDVILEEFQKGYYYADRVVRTAKVKVGKKKN